MSHTMQQARFILLVALAAAMLAWGVAQLLLERFSGERRKITRRLATGGRSELDDLLGAGGRQMLRDKNDLPAMLARIGMFRELNRRLQAAWPDASIGWFLAACGAIAAVGFIVAGGVLHSIVGGLLGAAAAASLPLMILNRRRTARQRRITAQLPDALDFLGRVLQAGHSLANGIQMMGDELPSPLGAEFSRCYDQHSMGQSLEQALRDMAGRIESADFAFFITSVLIQRQTGGDLGEVLRNISGMIRARVKLQQRVKAVTAEGRLTGYLLLAFPPVLLALSFLLNPAYAGVLFRTTPGKGMLGAAALLQFIGLLVIRRIVNVRA